MRSVIVILLCFTVLTATASGVAAYNPECRRGSLCAAVERAQDGLQDTWESLKRSVWDAYSGQAAERRATRARAIQQLCNDRRARLLAEGSPLAESRFDIPRHPTLGDVTCFAPSLVSTTAVTTGPNEHAIAVMVLAGLLLYLLWYVRALWRREKASAPLSPLPGETYASYGRRSAARDRRNRRSRQTPG